MKISKIKLIKEGMKGMSVTYLKIIKKDGVPFKVPHVVKYPYPVTGALSKALRDLEKHFGIINSLVPAIAGSDNYDNVAIQGMEVTESNFCLEASVEVIPGSFTTFKTPVINEAVHYHLYDECTEKIDQILTLVESYVEGEQKLDSNQIVLDFHKNDDDFDMDAFQILDEKEKHAMMIAELEKAGMIILQDEPMMKAI